MAVLPHHRPAMPSFGEKHVQRLLLTGFVLIIAILGADGFLGFRSILSTRSAVSALTDDQFRDVVLIDEVQRAQAALGSVLYKLYLGDVGKNRAQLELGVSTFQRSLRDLLASIPADDPDRELWREVELASVRLAADADRILDSGAATREDLNRLLEDREKLVSLTTTLIRANHRRAEATAAQIGEITSRHLLRDAVLLTAGLVIACLCAWLVLRTAARLHRRLTEQNAELARVTWQLLEKQETLARRLSHELHDELGQSLTALKTNFSRLSASAQADPAVSDDCSRLLRDSIRSAHEISQLLRPTILDDFGLSSAIGWLCERFEERNRIEVAYSAEFDGRLEPQTETHIFRIAQEALTNISRHAAASKVEVSLRRKNGDVVLRIADNGKGLPQEFDVSRPRLGLVGMRARARSIQGEMDVRSAPGRGTTIEVSLPWKAPQHHEEENTHLVG